MASLQHSSHSARTATRRSMAEINMVPFIDVMLVLLIIFMVTAPLITPSTIELPSVDKASRQPDRVAFVVIQADATMQVKFEGTQQAAASAQAVVSALSAALAQKSEQERAQTAVVISADKNVRYHSVIEVMAALQRAGLRRLGLSVQLAPGSAANASTPPTPPPAAVPVHAAPPANHLQ